jgi:hypothetical protein
MTDKPYTDAELRQFDLITSKLSSRDQLARIEARMGIKRFIQEHGKDKCDAMFEVLKQRNNITTAGNHDYADA